MSERTESSRTGKSLWSVSSHLNAPLMVLVTPIFLLIGACGTSSPDTVPEISANDLQAHVAHLASDALEGRRSGTAGGEKAARYLAREFERYGLEPAGDDGGYLQAFTFIAGVEPGRDNSLTRPDGSVTWQAGSDWGPLTFSDVGESELDVVFAGYGISAPDEGYDDYAGLDVEGKAVLVLPYGPPAEGGGMRFPSRHALRNKAFIAREHAAAAILFAPHPALDPADFLEPLRLEASPSAAGVLAASVTLATADGLLGADGSLAVLQEGIDGSGRPASGSTGGRVRLEIDVLQIEATGWNVAGTLAPAGPDAQWLLVGAHYDHLGMGGDGSLDPNAVAVHNGADDNASGTAGLLELAERFAGEPPIGRNLLFVAFAAEELGLLGSAYMAEHLPPAIQPVEGMLNMDMIGRMKDDALTIYGTGTAAGWDPLLDAVNAADPFNLTISRIPDGFGASDHSSFYAMQMPVLHFFTGTHDDYHRPSDDAETLDYAATERVVRFVEGVIIGLDARAGTLAYQAVSSPQQTQGGRAALSVYTGVVPDMAWQEKGFRITGVSDGSPAGIAGLEGGDIILRMGNRTINDIYDWMYALQEGSPGQRVEVEARRGEQSFTVQVVLGNRRAR